MNRFIEKLSNLINVKTIVTFMITIVFATLALRDEIPNETVMAIVVMVLGFYFGTQFEKNNQNSTREEDTDDDSD